MTHPTVHSQYLDPGRISGHQMPNGYLGILQEWTQVSKELQCWSLHPWSSDHGMVGQDLSSQWEAECLVWGANRDLFPCGPYVMVVHPPQGPTQ